MMEIVLETENQVVLLSLSSALSLLQIKETSELLSLVEYIH